MQKLCKRMLRPSPPLSCRSASWGSITTFCILRCAPAGTGACATPRWSFDCWVSQRQKLNNLIPTAELGARGNCACVCVCMVWCAAVCVAWGLAFCFAYFNEFYDSASDYDAHKQSGLGTRMPGRTPGSISFNHVFLLIAA